MNIAVFADEFNSTASGAKVAQYLTKLLLQNGHCVTVYTFVRRHHDVGLTNHPCFCLEVLNIEKSAAWHHLVRPQYVETFEKKIRKHRHELIHFLSFGYHKSRFLLSAAKAAGLRVVTQEFVYGSYCAREKDSRDDSGACGKCVRGNFLNALRYGCDDFHKWPVHALSRHLIRTSGLQLIDATIATCSYMVNSLHQWGLSPENIYRCPLPFDPNSIARRGSDTKDYWVFSGEFRHEKGINFIEQLIRSNLNFKLKCLLLVSPSRKEDYEKFLCRMSPYIECGKVEFDHLIRLETGGQRIVEEARGIILPTVWPSSTEYVLLEAMGMGKAIVTFDIGVHKDILKNGHNALVVRVGDLEGLATAIRKVDQDADLRQELGRNARRTFDCITDENLVLQSYMAAYTGRVSSVFSPERELEVKYSTCPCLVDEKRSSSFE